MNCQQRQHDIVLFLYDELSGPKSQELRTHLDSCTTCRTFHEREKELYVGLTEDFSEWEVPADLLVECRRGLSDSLDLAESRRSWWKTTAFAGVLSRMRLLESAALVSMGLALGVYVTNQVDAPEPAPANAVVTIPENASVSNLRIVEADIESGQIELAGEVIQPMRMTGNLEDASVREFLFGVMQSQNNPGSRLQVVELLSKQTRDPNIKEALINVLLNDDNPGVRLSAIDALHRFSEDEDVRQTLKYVLANDDNPGIRVQAIEALSPMTHEEAMDAVIQEAVREVPNEYVRIRELQYVGGGQ
jgi:hypothetical protein